MTVSLAKRPIDSTPLDVVAALPAALFDVAQVSMNTDRRLGLTVDIDGRRSDGCLVWGSVLFDGFDGTVSWSGHSEDDRMSMGRSYRWYGGPSRVSRVVAEVVAHFGLGGVA